MNQYGVDFTVMMQKVQQDLAEINVKLELQPVEFSVWREHVNGDGIPVTAVFFAPDLLRLLPVRAVFRHDGRHLLVQARRRRERPVGAQSEGGRRS